MFTRSLPLAVLAWILIASDGRAQVLSPALDPAASVAEIPPAPSSPAVIENGLTVSTYGSFYAAPGSALSSGGSEGMGYIPPYSYFAAPEGFPARPYVGLPTAQDFPFHGQPYGNPFDRWTWSSMTGSPPSSLVRYYYPPVP